MNFKQQRKIGTNRRSLTGSVSMRGFGAVQFESSLERDLLYLLDYDPSVTNVVAQPVKIPYTSISGKREWYVPDFFVEYDSQKDTIIEVKYQDDLKANKDKFEVKFDAARKYCEQRNMAFDVLTENEIRNNWLLQNVLFLRKYHTLPESEVTETHLARTLVTLGPTCPEALLAAAYLVVESRMKALPYLWKMIYRQRIHAELNEKLTMRSHIWIVNGEGF